MNNYVKDGHTRTWVNGTGSAVVAGQVVVVGQQLAIACTDIASGATGEVALDGMFVVPKVTTAVIANGEMVLWDVSAGKFDAKSATPATGDVSNAAIAAEAAGNGATTIRIQLANRLGSVT